MKLVSRITTKSYIQIFLKCYFTLAFFFNFNYVFSQDSLKSIEINYFPLIKKTNELSDNRAYENIFNYNRLPGFIFTTPVHKNISLSLGLYIENHCIRNKYTDSTVLYNDPSSPVLVNSYLKEKGLDKTLAIIPLYINYDFLSNNKVFKWIFSMGLNIALYDLQLNERKFYTNNSSLTSINKQTFEMSNFEVNLSTSVKYRFCKNFSFDLTPLLNFNISNKYYIYGLGFGISYY